MSGEKNLKTLLATMQPELHEGEYVFVSLQDVDVIPKEQRLLMFRETEGTTLVISKSVADEFGLSYKFIAAWITLKVHSALDAVGFTAAFSNAIAVHDISCNVVSGFYHDHIFVPVDLGEKAIEILINLSKSHRG